jgi:RimJ/RimL family protein N-acetyltransferase
MHTVWTGERVKLRPFKDEKEWCDLAQELEMVPNEFWGAWWSPRPELKKDFEPAGLLDVEKASMFAIERLDTGELVGYEEHGAPKPGSIEAWVGTVILRAHWHHGFGVEAKQLCYCYLFEHYPVERVWAATLSNHKRAARGLHLSGMRYQGRFRGFHFTDGKYHDLVCYALYREEWEKLPIRLIVKRG